MPDSPPSATPPATPAPSAPATFKFTVMPHAKASWDLSETEVTEGQLTEALTTHVEGTKDGHAFIPAILTPCPDLCRKPWVKKETGEVFGCGGPGGKGGKVHRLTDNVRAMTMFGADLDDVPSAAGEALLDHLDGLGVLYYLWTTHSHGDEETGRYRLVIPFNEPLQITNPDQWSKYAWQRLVEYFRVPRADPSCKDPARLYFFPRHEAEKPHAAMRSASGRLFNPRTLLGDLELRHSERKLVDPVPSMNLVDRGRPVPMETLEFIKRELRRVKREPLAEFCRNLADGKPVAPPKDERPADALSRNDSWFRALGVLSLITEDWIPSEAIIENLLRPSWQAEVRQDPIGHTPWEKIEIMLEAQRSTAPSRRAQYKADRIAQLEAARRMLDVVIARRKSGEEAEQDTVTETTDRDGNVDVVEDATAADTEDGRAWTEDEVFAALDGRIDKQGNKVISTDIRNLVLVLTTAPEWKGGIRRNELTDTLELHPCPALANLTAPKPVRDSDVTILRILVQQHPRYSMKPDRADMIAAMEVVGERNGYQPVVDYLNSIQWDGKERIDAGRGGWLADYLHVAIEDEGEDIADHVKTLGKRWLISAVARAYEPGCKADSILHIEGPQGAGKTTALEILGGKWYMESTSRFDKQDTLVLLSSAWIVELGELTSFSKADESTQKSFIARRVDSYVPKYEKFKKEVPRRCVFAGTTNQSAYLTDVTGNRRHWTVRMSETMTDEDKTKLKADRDQLWAEAVMLYRSGVQWHLTVEEREVAAKETAKRMRTDIIDDQIELWIQSMEPSARPRWLRPGELVAKMPFLEKAKDRDIREALTRVGFELKVVRPRQSEIDAGLATDNATLRAWVVPERLLRAPKWLGLDTAAGKAARALGVDVVQGGADQHADG